MDDLDHTGAPKRWANEREHLTPEAAIAPALAATSRHNARYREAVSIVLDLVDTGHSTDAIMEHARAFVALLLEEGTR